MQFNCQSKLKDTNVPYWRGGVTALSVHFLRRGHSNACRMRAGGGRGSKKAKKLRAHFMYGPWAPWWIVILAGICHTHFGAFNFMGWSTRMSKKGSNIVATLCFFHVGGFYSMILSCLLRHTYYHVNMFDTVILWLIRCFSEKRWKRAHGKLRLSQYE